MRKTVLSGWAVVTSLLLASTTLAGPRNVVLFVTDDQGQDAGCYGNKVIKTPNQDQLARDGTLFKYAFCTTASCSASRSVILSGLHNHTNGHYGHKHGYNHFSSFDRIKTLPVLLTDAGYRTARVGKYHVAPEDVYKFEKALPGSGRSPVVMANNCKEFISEKSDKPFFLFFCTSDPHRGGGTASELKNAPNRFGNRPRGKKPYPGIKEVEYSPSEVVVPPFLPDTPVCRAELAQYYQAVSRIDQGLGRLVQILKDAGKYDDTLIIYISDHGIAFPGAKTTVYEPGMRSPCLVRDPYARKRGVVSEAMISWVDLTPTILDFAKAKLPRKVKFHGRSFLSTLEQSNPKGWDEVYASHTFHEITMYYPQRCVRQRRFKLIWNIAHPLPYPFASDLWAAPTWQDVYKRYQKDPSTRYGKRLVKNYLQRPAFELYDLEKDPHEIHNLANDPNHAGVLKELKGKIKSFQIRTGDPWKLKWNYE